MAINRERPHVLVLPEDDATHDLAVGFVDGALGPMQVLNSVRGWSHVLEHFLRYHVCELRKYEQRHLVLLIDFDDDYPNRLTEFQSKMPPDIADRVYVLGALGEAEDLKRQTTQRKLGLIGLALAKECEQGQAELWNHAQLRHNQAELLRLQMGVKGFLF